MRSVFLFLVLVADTCNVFSQNSSDKSNSLLSFSNQQQTPDTANLRSPYIPVNGSGYIIFATAFRWNHSGPTGGYRSESIADDYVFYPVFSNVTSYRLDIYNRSGYKVFESEELSKGWDGYLKNGALAAQGVYIWKATGKYSDGTSFSKSGDVTFIY